MDGFHFQNRTLVQPTLFEMPNDDDPVVKDTVAPQLVGNGIRVLSFFSGAGGLDLGFHNRGFEIVAANEFVALFCETLKANSGHYVSSSTNVICNDICSVDVDRLPQDIDLIIGGPPCQTYSASGRRAGGAAGRLDARGNLFEAYSKIIAAVKPKGFLFENVRGILGTDGGKDWQEIVKTFAKIGYKLSYRILDACDYGIPQHRERLILVGHQLDGEFLFPAPTHGPDSYPFVEHVTPREAFRDIEQIEDLTTLTFSSGKYSDLLPLVPPGDNYLFFTAERGYPRPIFAYRSRFSDFLYKANPDLPIKTLIASPGKYTGPLHWDNRYFSISEYKRLQGFPDDYIFCGSRQDVIKQIGNSVSPKLAERLAEAIAKQLFDQPVELTLLPVHKSLSFDKRKSGKAKTTRAYHDSVVTARSAQTVSFLNLYNYQAYVLPTTLDSDTPNVSVTTTQDHVEINVAGDESSLRFATMVLEVGRFSDRDLSGYTTTLRVNVTGEEPHCIQTMWNAIDDWVIRSSNFHSLFELYGHFTEPHPIFSIKSFDMLTTHPIGKFAQFASSFSNCSRYFPKDTLIDLFGDVFGTNNFVDLAMKLRQYRFDVRSRETNIAIPSDVYMVAYPFTLPLRKQMNFSVKNIEDTLSINEL